MEAEKHARFSNSHTEQKILDLATRKITKLKITEMPR